MKPVEPAADLLRLSESSGSELASALRELSQRGPDATELASLATRLSLQGIALAPLQANPMPSPPSPRALGWKLALVGAVAISGVGSWLSLRAPTPANVLPAAGQRLDSGPASPARSEGVVAERSPREERRLAAPGGLGPAAPSASAAKTEPSESAPAPASTIGEETSSPPPAHAAAPTLPQAANASPVAEASPRNDSQARSPGRIAQPSGASGAAGPAPEAALPSELELLRGARLALKGSPAEALRFAEQHRARYPSGKLTQERELIAISALLGLGRRTAALSRAASFERAFPASPYRKQIGELLQ